MKRKILILIGSPRIGGNTELLAEAFAKGAREKHDVRIIHLGKTKVNGCLGCDLCYSIGKPCVQKDGMDAVYEALAWADTIVLASPLYFWHLSAQLKAVIDRLQAIGFKTNFEFPHKDVALLMVGATKKENAFDAVQAYYNYGIVDYLKWTDLGTLFVRRALHKGDIVQTDALAQAEAFGRSILLARVKKK